MFQDSGNRGEPALPQETVLVGIVFRVQQSLCVETDFSAQGFLLSGLVILRPEDISPFENAVAFSHNVLVTSL